MDLNNTKKVGVVEYTTFIITTGQYKGQWKLATLSEGLEDKVTKTLVTKNQFNKFLISPTGDIESYNHSVMTYNTVVRKEFTHSKLVISEQQVLNLKHDGNIDKRIKELLA